MIVPITTFRVQHKKTKLGIFTHKDYSWEHEDSEYAECILEKFKQIWNMRIEFPESLEDSIGDFKCAFKTFNHLVEILPPYLLNYLHRFDFEVVEIKGHGIKGNSQTFFRDCDVKIKSIPLDKVLRVIAKNEAKKHIGMPLREDYYIIQSA